MGLLERIRARQAPEPLGYDGIGAIVVLLLAASAPDGHVSDASLVYPAIRVLWWVVYFAAAARLAREFGARWMTWTIRHQRALCVLIALSFASSLWSLVPPFSLRKAASLAGTTVAGVFIGYACSPPRLMRVLHWTFALLIVCSVLVAVALPAPVLRDGDPLGWRGVMQHKNSFGAVAVWAVLFSLVVTLERRVRPLWGVLLGGLWLAGLTASRSRTSWVTLGASLAALAALAIASAERHATRATLRRISLGFVLVGGLLPFVLGPVASFLGNDDPLNGRTRLWAGARAILAERPATGYGYAVVWARSEATLLPHIPITARRSATNAHNGIIDVATELGIPAALVACLCLFGALSSAGRLFEREPSGFSLFALLFLWSFTVMNFTEAHLLRIHSVFWILFVAIAVAVERARGGTAAMDR